MGEEVSQMQAFAQRVADLSERHKVIREEALGLALEMREYRQMLRDLPTGPMRAKALQVSHDVEKKLMTMAGDAVEISRPELVLPPGVTQQ